MSRADDLAKVDVALTRVARIANSRRAARERSRLSGVDLLPTAVWTLAAVNRLGPVRLTELAGEMELEPSRISKEVNRLAEVGLVEQETDPTDRRAVLITATDKGADAWDRYRKAVDQQLARTLEGWTDRDITKLAALLTRLSAAVAGEST